MMRASPPPLGRVASNRLQVIEKNHFYLAFQLKRSSITEIGTNIKLREIVPMIQFLVCSVRSVTRSPRPLLGLAGRIHDLILKSGKPMAVLYLKQCQMDCFHYLAGTPRKRWSGQGPIVRVDDSGLPIIIPPRLRSLIKDRDLVTIKLVLTILGIYRTVSIKGVLNLSTITDSGNCQISKTEFSSTWKSLVTPSRLRWTPRFSWSYLVTAGPNGSLSIGNASLDALAFLVRPHMLYRFIRLAPKLVSLYLVFIGCISAVYLILYKIPFSLFREIRDCPPPTTRRPNFRVSPLIWLRSWIPDLGRLSVKHEAAGKERVFAITDWWTQNLLKSLHQSVFSFLRSLPQDGTFDQLAPVHRLLDTARLGMKVFSFDLSAATDRFPVELQEEVLAVHIGPERARWWKDLLIKRSWVLYDELSGNHYLKYGVGQPMGAYSSWAVFALTHHCMVQVAATRTGYKGWYPFYALLGDDIVIAGEDVAKAYLALAGQIGVEISMAKSLVSDVGLAEFAKHLISPYRDYSPIGARGLLAAYREGLYLPSYAQDLRDKAFPIFPWQLFTDLQSTVSFRRDGRAIANHYRGVLSVFGPGGAFSLPLADWMFLTINPVGFRGWLPPGDAKSLLYTISSIVQRKRDNLQAAIQQNSKEFWSQWYLGLDAGLPNLLSFLSPRFWVKALELEELECQEFPGYSTFDLRERVHFGEQIPVEEILRALRGPEYVRGTVIIPDRGPLGSNDWAIISRRMAKLAMQLRRQTLVNRSNFRPGGNIPIDLSLILRDPALPDITTFCFVERLDDVPGMPWMVCWDTSQLEDRKLQSRLNDYFSRPADSALIY